MDGVHPALTASAFERPGIKKAGYGRGEPAIALARAVAFRNSPKSKRRISHP